MKEKKRLYVREQERWAQECAKQYWSERSLQVMTIEKGILLPPDNWNPQTGEFQGGVCESNGKFVAGLFRNQPPHAGFYGISAAYPFAADELAYVDRDVIFGGILIGHFGHFILECLGRLWYVLERDEPHKTLVFLTELEVCPWFGDFFALLGISRERIIFVQKPTQFRKVVVPEEAVHSWYNYTQEYLRPYHYMTEQARKLTGNKSLGPKIFLTRNRLSDSQTKCINEEYFCRFFAQQGYTMVELETLPLAEQIAIVNNAEEIVAIMGSLTHWALFCQPGTKFTMLTRTSNDILGSQCLINEAAQVDWYIVDTAMNLFYANRAVGVCLIGPTVYWQAYVKAHYGNWQDDGSWKTAYHEYLREWTDYMLQPEKWETVKSLDPLALLTRINKALHQNEQVIDRTEMNTGSANFMVVDGGFAYFWSENDNSLLSCNPISGEKRHLYHKNVREFPENLYGMPVKAGSHIILTPENAYSVLDYDLATGEAVEISLPQALPRGNFRYALAYKNYVLMVGYYSGQIIVYDPSNREIRCLTNLPLQVLGLNETEPQPWGGKPCLLGDKLYVPVIDTNQVVELNLPDGSYNIHQVGEKEAAYGYAAAYAGNVWLAPSQGGPLAVWNPPTGVMQVFGSFPQDFTFARIDGKIRFFTDITICGNWLWLLPWGAKQFLRLNMENGEFSIAARAVPVMDGIPYTYCGCTFDTRVFVLGGADGRIYIVSEDEG